MGREGFRGLVVWHRAKALAVAVYRVTDEGRISRDFGLRDQMRRAAVSVCSNIAEGEDRGSDKDSVRYFRITKGSLAELRAQVELALAIDLLDAETAERLESDALDVTRMITALIKARSPH
jgi:four helix bundle protein